LSLEKEILPSPFMQAAHSFADHLSAKADTLLNGNLAEKITFSPSLQSGSMPVRRLDRAHHLNCDRRVYFEQRNFTPFINDYIV
jgi:hypothetical protein